MPPILCGDFNAQPTSDEIRFLTANAVIDERSTYFQDAWAVLDDRGGVTFDPANDLYDESNELPQRIDYVFVGESYRPNRRGPGAERVAGIRQPEDRGARERPLRTLRRDRLADASAGTTLTPSRTAVRPGTPRLRVSLIECTSLPPGASCPPSGFLVRPISMRSSPRISPHPVGFAASRR